MPPTYCIDSVMCVRWFTTDRNTRLNVKGGTMAKTNYSVHVNGKMHINNLAFNDALREAGHLGQIRRSGCVTVKQGKRIEAIWFKGMRIALKDAEGLKNEGVIL